MNQQFREAFYLSWLVEQTSAQEQPGVSWKEFWPSMKARISAYFALLVNYGRLRRINTRASNRLVAGRSVRFVMWSPREGIQFMTLSK